MNFGSVKSSITSDEGALLLTEIETVGVPEQTNFRAKAGSKFSLNPQIWNCHHEFRLDRHHFGSETYVI
jgi:hypothetical protein